MKQPLAVWGGSECTVNRVGDAWYNQLALSGHSSRLSDLDMIADLGIRTIRFPLLWELTVDSSGRPEWEWADRWLARVRELGIRPIVGLVHHGSGPGFTNLLDEHFAERLAVFAAEVATRFPWVTDYTPINEPLTTARFSALYGHWYPHRRDNDGFCQALLNQCRGIVLAMRAIRGISPGARLIQTEDLGTTYSTDHMAYQRDFDNERRWLTWDLLSGRVSREHRLTPFFLRSSCHWPALQWFVDNPCAPDVIGINHYVTSDRFLDERTVRYPDEAAGSNSRDDYIDVPAVRVLPGAYRGWRVLYDAWQRYRAPLALTEVHLGCTREEQLRWFHEAWNAAQAAQQLGCDVIGVTSWALFGSYHWDHLLTRDSGSYEPGAFDCSSSAPRPTAVAHLLRRLSARLDGVHPSMRSRGWWQRASKLTYPLDDLPTQEPECTVDAESAILMIESESPQGRAMARACARRHLLVKMASPGMPRELGAIRRHPSLQQLTVWAIIDTRVDSVCSTRDEDSGSTPVALLADFSLGAEVDSIVIEVVTEAASCLSMSHWEQLCDASLNLLIDQAGGSYVYTVDDHVLRPRPTPVLTGQIKRRNRSFHTEAGFQPPTLRAWDWDIASAIPRLPR